MFTLPELPYEPSALEPHIDAQTMSIHHDKHHAGYVSNLNAALAGHDDLLSKDIDELMADLQAVPKEIHTAVQNNGGGHANHSLFWTIMSPQGGGNPSGSLLSAIDGTFTSVDALKEQLHQAGMTRFGSGWAWLVIADGKLEVMSTANQDSPLSVGKTPILGIDVWEHAYYLKYQNLRADYLKAFWNVVSWKEVERRFEAGM